MTDVITLSLPENYREKFEAIATLVNKNNSETFRLMIDFFFFRQDRIMNGSLESIDHSSRESKNKKQLTSNQKNISDFKGTKFEEAIGVNLFDEEEKENGDDQ